MNEDLVALMRARIPPGFTVELPPKCFLDRQADMVELLRDEDDPARTVRGLTLRFPVQERYQNPLRYMQGGYIVAAGDNTLGPLSWLAAPPSVTSQLNTSYIRPVTPDDASIVVAGRVTELTRRQLFLEAKVTNAAGKLVAISQATCTIVNG